MKKATSLLLAAALIGSLGVASFAPAAYADGAPGVKKRGERTENHKRRGFSGRGGSGGFIRLMCSEDGAARLENALSRNGERITLSDDQQNCGCLAG